MKGSKFQPSQEAKLLGVTLDSKLMWTPRIILITRKATPAFMQCRQIVGKTWGTKPFIRNGYTLPSYVQLCRMHVCPGLAVSTNSSKETHEGAETSLPDDFIRFSWHPYW